MTSNNTKTTQGREAVLWIKMIKTSLACSARCYIELQAKAIVDVSQMNGIIWSEAHLVKWELDGAKLCSASLIQKPLFSFEDQNGASFLPASFPNSAELQAFSYSKTLSWLDVSLQFHFIYIKQLIVVVTVRCFILYGMLGKTQQY